MSPEPNAGAPGRTPPLVVVVGPTATGKSDLALELALRLDGEVVNADAMQLYRGLDVGTAKLAPDERRGVPHHQLDVLDVTEAASVAAYQRRARADIESLRAAGRTPVLVGGSGLYVQAVVDELEFPGTDPELRARLEAELAECGAPALHRRLAESDPAAAADLLPSNGRRIVRALEVIALTGRAFRARMPVAAVPRYDAVLIGVDRDTAVLDERIAVRVQAMLAGGMVAETRALTGQGLRGGRTASRALGYRQILDALDEAGSDDAELTPDVLEQVRAQTVRATRRFVRRQRSWFRRDTRIHWLDGADPRLPDRALDALRTSSRVRDRP
ncbi:MAG: tRNA (adenosine(37)-N6)-dimethylallyltransferase MiaA [Pseudonocardia sp.]|nr:tRNA (adenosine(37)-N6)-dimethylallyltransferase MiaA [Pseudonocardia sp.]